MKTISALSFILAAFVAANAAASTHYVDLNCTNPAAPYTSWATAATNIQHAVDAAVSGETVLVTNGVYATGGRRWFDSGTNRVTLTNSIILQSVNGPAVTFIVGHQVVGGGTVLTNAARCVGMGNNAVLSGFTLTNGSGGWGNYPYGGGVANIVSGSSTVTNCVLIGNLSPTAFYGGGGAYRVKLINCQLIGNQAGYGGGACACELVNCLVASNTASYGGGVFGNTTFGVSALTNCTIVGNSATNSGGGVNNGNAGAMYNCIVYYNAAPTESNYAGIKVYYCCTTPVFAAIDNSISNAPMFVNPANGNFRLLPESPCINAGRNMYAPGTADLDGNPRIAGSTIDIGAYEYPSPASVLPYAWLQQYGLPVDGSADYADADSDGLNNWQEWIANTNPTNAASVLMMNSLSNSVSDVTITWQSVSGRSYFLQRASDLTAASAFSAIKSNIFGQAGTTTYTDTTATNGGPYFYRVGVQ